MDRVPDLSRRAAARKAVAVRAAKETRAKTLMRAKPDFDELPEWRDVFI
jgi:hypothetical protein